MFCFCSTGWKTFGIVKLKRIGLWQSLLFMALKQRDKVFCGNRSSNVKPDSRTSTPMETLLLALGRWIVKATALSVYMRLFSYAQYHFPKHKDWLWKEPFFAAHYRSSGFGFSFARIIIRPIGTPERSRNFHLQRGFEGTDIYHPQHLHGSGAHSHITLIRILWEVIPLTLPLKGVHCRHGRGKTNHIYYPPLTHLKSQCFTERHKRC